MSATTTPRTPQEAKLLPLCVGKAAFEQRCALLPPGIVLPSCPPPGVGTDELHLVLVFSDMAAPVLSVHLQAWSATFEDCMRLATDNLKGLARADVSFEAHPTGARASRWHDGFDATRAVLMPELLKAAGAEGAAPL